MTEPEAPTGADRPSGDDLAARGVDVRPDPALRAGPEVFDAGAQPAAEDLPEPDYGPEVFRQGARREDAPAE